MLTLRRGQQLHGHLRAACCRQMATQQLPQPVAGTEADADSEYTQEAQYPAIKDLSYRARKRDEAKNWYEEIRRVPTIEEKMIKINMPRYYGYKVLDLSDAHVGYNALPLMQHYTRTMMLDEAASSQEAEDKKFDVFLQTARADAIEALEFAHEIYNNQLTRRSTQPDPVTREQELTQIIVEQLNRCVLQTLSADYTHLHDIEVDYNPRHEAFWAVGGVDPPKNVVKSKKGRSWQKEYANDSVDRLVQYTGTPYLALRHHLQLAPWKSPEECENAELAKQVPRYNHDARTLGYLTKYQHAVNVPGYWPSARNANFGLLSIQSRARLQLRPDACGEQDAQEALHVLAIQSSYAWLLAQAHYNGFNTYNELTYPMNTQTIITNGREWSFYEYQLNTLLQHGSFVDENARLNFCRGSSPQPLYAEITPAGKVLDFNDNVLRQLLRFYANTPSVQRSTEELQPYVGESGVRRAADYSNVEQREFLLRIFKHLTSKRPRHLELPEIFTWEKLYKIDNKTRPLEARRRFFERDINPWRRTLDQHDKVYVPRAVRPGGPKNRATRFEKTYYP